MDNKAAAIIKKALERTQRGEEAYGAPENNFERIARLWNAYLGGHDIDAKDVAYMMMLLKIGRTGAATTDDTLVDIVGYALCAADLEEGA